MRVRDMTMALTRIINTMHATVNTGRIKIRHLFRMTAAGLALGVLVACAPMQPQTRFTPPQQIIHEGTAYTLAFQQGNANSRVVSEYTYNGESVENWSKLVTVQYVPGKPFTPLALLQALEKTLKSETPVPHYSLYMKGEHGYAQIIYEPTAKAPWFESDVFKSFHRPACAGQVLYQYAFKYPPPQQGEDKQAVLRKILADNRQAADAMEKSAWQPDCS